MEYTRVYITQDDDGHWYVMPYELKEDFDQLLEACLEGAYESEDAFNEKFSQYMTGGSLDLVELYIKTEQI